MIFVAAGFIIVTSVDRLMHPAPAQSLGLGLAISTVASVINGAVGMLLIRTGAKHRSVTLSADGKHLLTDVWTSAGVIVGVLLVAVTGWTLVDPIVAILVVNILVTGFRPVSQSVTSLLDAALPPEELAQVDQALATVTSTDVDFSHIRTRASGRHRFVSATVLVPGDWTVDRAHEVAAAAEAAITAALPHSDVQAAGDPTHHQHADDTAGHCRRGRLARTLAADRATLSRRRSWRPPTPR